MVPLYIPRIENKLLVHLTERPKNLEKIDPSVTSPTTYLTWAVLAVNRCLCGEKRRLTP